MAAVSFVAVAVAPVSAAASSSLCCVSAVVFALFVAMTCGFPLLLFVLLLLLWLWLWWL